MSNRATPILIVKLAAIGDVAIACRALSEILAESPRPFDIHWIIDRDYQKLAESLIERMGAGSSKIFFHPVDSRRIFRGSVFEKIAESAKLFRIAAKVRAHAAAVLHADRRYAALLYPACKGRVVSIDRGTRPELEEYRRVLANILDVKPRSKEPTPPAPFVSHRCIGVHVGGAVNAKTAFREKLWPFIPDLVELLLATTSYKIVLLGGPEDVQTASAIMSRAKVADGRIENLAGKVALHELADVLAGLDRLVTVDTGAGHIAANVMTAKEQGIVSIFGPTDPAVWTPAARGKANVTVLWSHPECAPCYKNDGRFLPCIYSDDHFQICMTAITPAQVVQALALG